MKAKDIQVGAKYTAKVGGKLTTVQVKDIRYSFGSTKTVYDVVNLTTGRWTTFRSAAKFRSEVTLSPAS